MGPTCPNQTGEGRGAKNKQVPEEKRVHENTLSEILKLPSVPGTPLAFSDEYSCIPEGLPWRMGLLFAEPSRGLATILKTTLPVSEGSCRALGLQKRVFPLCRPPASRPP
jgi:hypothetical protein